MSNIQELLKKADNYKYAVSLYRPVNSEQLKQIDNYFKIDLTYSSNALEGNTLTLSETKILIEDGITVSGKPLKDYLEAEGHSKAYDYLLSIAKDSSLLITEDMIKKFHYLFYSGIDPEHAGKYRDIQVYISGTEYIPPASSNVPELMKELADKINNSLKNHHPVIAAAYAHKWLVDIHPFIDGNGRTARLLMNLILINKGYGVTSIHPVLRNEYIQSLRLSQKEKNADDTMFLGLIAECVIETQKDLCRLLGINTKEYFYLKITPDELKLLEKIHLDFEQKIIGEQILIRFKKEDENTVLTAINKNKIIPLP